jgi:multidrug efflux pump subunit AcrB
MMAVLVAGVIIALTLRREFFPESDPDAVRITMPYPGATPQEIEESLARKVEDAVVELDEVDEITTTISEGVGVIVVEFRDGVSVSEGHEEVERAVELLTDLPEESEEIRVVEFEPRLPAIMLTLFGDAGEEVLKQSIRDIADELRSLPGMGEIEISGVREYEIRVDVAPSKLLEHALSLPQVSDAIRAWMSDVPGGTVRTSVGNINVRTMGVPEQAEMISQIALKATADGQLLRVGDIATVHEDFVDDQILTRFNGLPSASLTVFKTGRQDAVDMAQMVRAYADGRTGKPFQVEWRDRVFHAIGGGGSPDQRPRSKRQLAYDLGASSPDPLPAQLATHSDLARFIEGRLDLLTENAFQGAVLIFLTILLAMNLRAAWWVMTGLVTAICGTLILMFAFDVTLNLLTMFGLLITLGMLEDDAIVVSENIIARHERGEPPIVAAIKGAEQVFWPVIGTVLTTIVAFLPLMLVKGRLGDLLGALPWVVMFSLLVSVVETMTSLPSHMAHSLEKRAARAPGRIARLFRRFESWRDRTIIARLIEGYSRFLALSMEYRYVSTAIAIAVLIASLGLVAGGRVEFTFLPESDAETIVIDVRMPVGTALTETDAVVRKIENAATSQPEAKSLSAIIGRRVDVESGVAEGSMSHVAQLYIELQPVESRSRDSAAITDSMRSQLGVIEAAESIRFSEISGGPGGADITIRVTGDAIEAIEPVVRELKAALGEFEGVHDIADDASIGQRELQVTLKPGAAALGFSVTDVARQVRGALYGLEPHIYSAHREDIYVRVRLEESSRRTLSSIQDMWVTGADGRQVPLAEIALLEEARSYSTIRRIDRERAVTVTADTAEQTNPEEVVAELMPTIHRLREAHRDLKIELAGRQQDLADAFASLPLAFGAALLMIYVILAWLFGSYTEPLAVMVAIPFALIGVVWGHLLLGYQLTFLSLIGFVALTGVVVNNSLILIEFYNHKRDEGLPMKEALLAAGRDRLRPIVLTSITTFFGLMPLVFERSFQAKFLIPMAISISFGLLSATILTLAVLPCVLVIIDNIKAAGHYLWHGMPRPDSHVSASPDALAAEE